MGLRLTENVRRRFEEKLRRDPETGCLLWMAYTDECGYGIFAIGSSNYKAHRIAFLLAGGELTAQRPHVLHSCPCGDNKRCCEPTHLRAGSNAENMDDVKRRGQGPRSRSGLPFGVRREKSGRFTAQARIGETQSFGTFDTWQEASAVAMLHKNLALFPDVRVN